MYKFNSFLWFSASFVKTTDANKISRNASNETTDPHTAAPHCKWKEKQSLLDGLPQHQDTVQCVCPVLSSHSTHVRLVIIIQGSCFIDQKHIYIYVYIYTYTYMCTVYMCVFICIHISVYVYKCVYVYVYI